MRWTAIVPMKQGKARKSRMASHLSSAQRFRLNDMMTAHVLMVLRNTPSITRIVALSPTPPSQTEIEWVRDVGRGINAELGALHQRTLPILVIHGDLPLLKAREVEALLSAAMTHGVAIAPDRHGDGTNALAIADGRPFRFAFGEHSARKHQSAADNNAKLIVRLGLAHDVDTPEDLKVAAALGAFGQSDCASTM